jgi:hypothetical protein
MSKFSKKARRLAIESSHQWEQRGLDGALPPAPPTQPYEPDAGRVRRVYRQDLLARTCTLSERRFGRAYGMETVKVEGSRWTRWPSDYYHFRDNGSRVLAVAHLDTVVRKDRRAARFRDTDNGPLVVSGALDDRLGAYVILHLLPALGIKCDWLFTVGEEDCSSTAEWFEPRKDYDWMIEFDRMGTDVVMYQYEDLDSRDVIEAAGAVLGHGSYSDIACMDHLGIKGFNWGVGYRGDYHSERGYAYLNDTFAMVAKYLRFHEQNAETPMPHTGYYASFRSYDEVDEYYDCDTCGEKRVVDSVTWYCTFCGSCADCGATNPDVAEEWGDPDVDVCQCYDPSRKRREADRDESPTDGSWAGADLALNVRQAGEDRWRAIIEASQPAVTGQIIQPRDPAGTGVKMGGSWHDAGNWGVGMVAGHFAGPQHADICKHCADEFPESAIAHRELVAGPRGQLSPAPWEDPAGQQARDALIERAEQAS